VERGAKRAFVRYGLPLVVRRVPVTVEEKAEG